MSGMFVLNAILPYLMGSPFDRWIMYAITLHVGGVASFFSIHRSLKYGESYSHTHIHSVEGKPPDFHGDTHTLFVHASNTWPFYLDVRKKKRGLAKGGVDGSRKPILKPSTLSYFIDF